MRTEPERWHAERRHEAHEGHDAHEGRSPEMLPDRFWLSLALTIPVVYWSVHVQDLAYGAAHILTAAAIPSAAVTWLAWQLARVAINAQLLRRTAL